MPARTLVAVLAKREVVDRCYVRLRSQRYPDGCSAETVVVEMAELRKAKE